MILHSLLLSTALLLGDGPEVKAELIPSPHLISPGGTTLLAVHLELEPGWHVYWENPGDSGLATSVEVKGPEGFTIGPVLYPAPKRIDQPGGLVCFGYEDSACLFVEVTAPKHMQQSDYLFTAEVQWLVCKEVCFLGEARLHAKLKRGHGIGSPTTDERILPHLARLPQPLSNWPGAQAHILGPPADRALIITLPPCPDTDATQAEKQAARAEFFPTTLPGVKIGELEVLQCGRTLKLRVSCTFWPKKSPPPASVRGVLVVTTRDEKLTYLSLETPWPLEAEDL